MYLYFCHSLYVAVNLEIYVALLRNMRKKRRKKLRKKEKRRNRKLKNIKNTIFLSPIAAILFSVKNDTENIILSLYSNTDLGVSVLKSKIYIADFKFPFSEEIPDATT